MIMIMIMIMMTMMMVVMTMIQEVVEERPTDIYSAIEAANDKYDKHGGYHGICDNSMMTIMMIIGNHHHGHQICN